MQCTHWIEPCSAKSVEKRRRTDTSKAILRYSRQEITRMDLRMEQLMARKLASLKGRQ